MERGVEFEEINLEGDPLMKKRVMEEMGWKTVPIILVGDRLIGGFRELSALVKEGRLEELLNG
jgi:glutaredoxin 3